MVGIGSALSDHLNLAAGSAIKVGRLADGTNLELFNALDRSRNYAGRRTASGVTAAITIARSISCVRAGHIVAVVASIELEAVLVRLRAGHVTGQGYADLQHGESG